MKRVHPFLLVPTILVLAVFAGCKKDKVNDHQEPVVKDESAPKAPSGLSFNGVDHSLKWGESSDDVTKPSEIKYYVFVFPNNEAPKEFTAKEASYVVTGETSKVIDLKAFDSEKLGAVIVAVDLSGKSARSEGIYEFNVPDASDKEAPTAPSDILYKDGKIKWTGSQDDLTLDEKIVYRVYISTDGNPPATTSTTKPYAEVSGSTEVALKEEYVGKNLFVVVKAVDEAGKEKDSSPKKIIGIIIERDPDFRVDMILIELVAHIVAASAEQPDWKIKILSEPERTNITGMSTIQDIPTLSIKMGPSDADWKAIGNFKNDFFRYSFVPNDDVALTLPPANYTLIDFVPLVKIDSADPRLAILKNKTIQFVRPVHAFKKPQLNAFFDPLTLSPRGRYYLGRRIIGVTDANTITPKSEECTTITVDNTTGRTSANATPRVFSGSGELIFTDSQDLTESNVKEIQVRCTGRVVVKETVDGKPRSIHIKTTLYTDVIKSIE